MLPQIITTRLEIDCKTNYKTKTVFNIQSLRWKKGNIKAVNVETYLRSNVSVFLAVEKTLNNVNDLCMEQYVL